MSFGLLFTIRWKRSRLFKCRRFSSASKLAIETTRRKLSTFFAATPLTICRAILANDKQNSVPNLYLSVFSLKHSFSPGRDTFSASVAKCPTFYLFSGWEHSLFFLLPAETSVFHVVSTVLTPCHVLFEILTRIWAVRAREVLTSVQPRIWNWPRLMLWVGSSKFICTTYSFWFSAKAKKAWQRTETYGGRRLARLVDEAIRPTRNSCAVQSVIFSQSGLRLNASSELRVRSWSVERQSRVLYRFPASFS